MCKTKGVASGLVGAVIARFEGRGFGLRGIKALRMGRELAARDDAGHVDKPCFEGLVAVIASAPVVAMVWEGREAVTVARAMMGATDSAQAAPGTIRGDFSLSKEENVVHGSDSLESAAREIGLFFDEAELV